MENMKKGHASRGSTINPTSKMKAQIEFNKKKYNS